MEIFTEAFIQNKVVSIGSTKFRMINEIMDGMGDMSAPVSNCHSYMYKHEDGTQRIIKVSLRLLV